MKRKNLMVVPLPDYEPEIGRWIWCLEDVRRTILERISGINQSNLDRKLNGGRSIGSLLYHIALIEADWFYEEVLVGEWNPKIRSLFPLEDRNNDGTLTYIEGRDLDEHLHCLKSVREQLLSHFRSMDLKDWRKPRILNHYDVTPEWVIYHLIEHESHHRGQIFQMLATFKDPKSDEQESDLPTELAKPAKRALVGAGYLRLEQLAKLSEAEILQLHGMGPKALDQIRRAFIAKGISFAEKS